MVIMILVFGFIFGGIIQYANLNKFNVISGLARLEDFAVLKAIAVAVGLGILFMNIEIGMGLATYHVKPLIVGGIVFGGLIFGTGMAILGYCPGTLPISLGQGSVDAFIGIVGGLFGGLVYTLISPSLSGILGPDLGVISVNSLIGTNFIFYIVSIVIAALFVAIAFWLHKKEKTTNYKWLYAGIALAILNSIMILIPVFNRPIGASTSFPYTANLITGLTQNDYFSKIETPGNWELIFLTGAFLAGLIISLIKKDFKITLIYSSWKEFKGVSKIKRIVWSFIGGFVLIIGARIADGCTSGHILSGGMQLAISSLLFIVTTFTGLLITGKFFYKRPVD